MKTISRVVVLMAFLIAGTAVGSFAQQEKPKKEKKEKDEKKEKKKKEEPNGGQSVPHFIYNQSYFKTPNRLFILLLNAALASLIKSLGANSPAT